MLYLLMAACTGGPDNATDTGNVVDTTNLVIDEFGATIDGEPSRTVDVYVMINEDSTSCQMNLEINNCYGVVFDTVQIPNVSHVQYELTDGVCLNVSAGDTNHTTSFGAPTHLEGATTFFSNPLDVGEEETKVVIDLTWYLEPDRSWYVYRDLEVYIDGKWTLTEVNNQVSGGPHNFETSDDNCLIGDFDVISEHPCVFGDGLEDDGDKGMVLYNTWQSEDGTRWGVTNELDKQVRQTFTVIDRSTL